MTVTAGTAVTISPLTGTGEFAGLNGTYNAVSVSGNTLTYHAATGLGAATIAGGSMGGSTLTLQAGQTLVSAAVNLAPVTIGFTNESTLTATFVGTGCVRCDRRHDHFDQFRRPRLVGARLHCRPGYFCRLADRRQRERRRLQRRRDKSLLHDCRDQRRRAHRGRAKPDGAKPTSRSTSRRSRSRGTNGTLSPTQSRSQDRSRPTITLTNGGTWSALGYTVGQGIFVGSSTDPNGNGRDLQRRGINSYYTIAAINGNVLTLQTAEP